MPGPDDKKPKMESNELVPAANTDTQANLNNTMALKRAIVQMLVRQQMQYIETRDLLLKLIDVLSELVAAYGPVNVVSDDDD